MGVFAYFRLPRETLSYARLAGVINSSKTVEEGELVMRLRSSRLALSGVAALGLLLGCPLGDGTPAELPVFEVDTDAGAGLTGVDSCSLAWGDYDNDGDLDLALSGIDAGYNHISKVYRNDAGTFADIGAALVGVAGSVAWGDYDNDGDLDLALSGCEDRFCSVLTSKIYRNDGGTFADALVGIEDVAGVLAWGDYDNDGDLDLALAGLVYRNDGGTFTGIDMGLDGFSVWSLAWGDYDNDGDLDLAAGGSDGPRSYVNKVFRNDGGAFTDAGVLTTDFAAGSLAWGDYDGDGDLDLALSGSAHEADATWRFESMICRNDGGVFTDAGAGLAGISGTVAWGDYDSDGDPDLLLAGWDRVVGHACHWDYYGAASKVYRNDGGTFTSVRAGLVGIRGSAAWGDYDNDGDLDLALAGLQTTEDMAGLARIYRNDGWMFNIAPAAPGGLGATCTGSGPYDVTFSWLASTDARTPETGLSYNLRVGTTSGGNEVLSGMARADGRRKLPARGVVQPGLSVNEWTLTLPAGTYYWSVQAIDTAFAASAWPAEQTMTVP
ncbi:MAG: FG-GAP repeat domain-containing protein [Planctomycetota bacterium]|jgi:predicted nucleotidyltransferase